MVGLGLVLGGLAELGWGLYPYTFGNPEWEFGSLSDFLNRLPLLGLGLTLVLASALRRGFSTRALLWATLLLLVAVVVSVFGLLLLTNLPVVLASQPDGPIRVQLLKGAAKSGVQTAVYALAFGGTGIYAIQAARRIRAA